MPRRRIPHTFVVLLTALSLHATAQQVVQRGPFGKPAQVLDDTQQWSTPLLLASDHDVDIYIPDVSSNAWLEHNYPDYHGRQQYVLSFYTRYRTPRACRANQIAWGNSDAAHLDACATIAYRVRALTVDAHLRTVTLISAAMVDPDGQIVPGSQRDESISRNWTDLDPQMRAALEKATDLVTKQMAIYNRRIESRH